MVWLCYFFFFQAEDGIRDLTVTGVQTCALPILHHVDVEFLWELLRAIPAAEASEGHSIEAGRDVTHLSVLIDDAIDSGEGDVADALRPLYLDYLTKHGIKG